MIKVPLMLRVVMMAVLRVSWRTATLASFLHFLSAWMALHLVGEAFAASSIDMVYYYVTTATTIGYGDLSPQTPAGRLIAAFWVMPGALAAFAWGFSKLITLFTLSARKTAMGLASYNKRTGHNLFIGFVLGQTRTLIAETDKGSDTAVLCTVQDLEGKLPEGVDWVRAEQLSDAEALERAGIAGAERIIIMTGDDETTTSVCLSIAGNWPNKEAVALFNEASKANLIAKACPKIRAVVAPASMLLARAASSPHAETVIHNLLSVHVDDALRCATVRIKPGMGMPYHDFQLRLITNAKITPIAVTHAETGKTDLSPQGEVFVRNGDIIHYMGVPKYHAFDENGSPIAD